MFLSFYVCGLFEIHLHLAKQDYILRKYRTTQDKC